MSWIVTEEFDNLDSWETNAVYGPFRSERAAQKFAHEGFMAQPESSRVRWAYTAHELIRVQPSGGTQEREAS